MERHEILELLLRDHSHDALVERPELYSVEEDMYQSMFAERDFWNREILRLMENSRKSLKAIMKEEPPEVAQYYMHLYTEEYIHRAAHRRYRLHRMWMRIIFHKCLARFWRDLLTARPEFVERCPWHTFRGDMIWMSLRDEAFCKALAIPKQEIALKMPLKLMSFCAWEELLKTVPELQPVHDGLVATGYKFEAHC